MAVTTLLAAQNGAFGAILGGEEEMVWKVLLYDTFTKDILSPVVKVTDLRRSGVTLHLMITSSRQPINSATAIYFVRPTEENIMQIIKDMQQRLYGVFEVHFCQPPSSEAIHRLGHGIPSYLTSPVSRDSFKVAEQFLSYICMGEDSFSLGMKDSFQILNSPESALGSIPHCEAKSPEAYIDEMITRLLTVIVTQGRLPMIAAIGRGVAGHIASILAGRLADLAKDNILDTSATAQRPVLVIYDRDVDLPSMVAHPWSYRGLVEEHCDIRLNSVTLADPKAEKKTRNAELDPTSDMFWRDHSDQQFGDTMHEFDAYTKSVAGDVAESSKINSDDLESMSNVLNNAAGIKRKRDQLANHTAILGLIDTKVRELQLQDLVNAEKELQAGRGTAGMDKLLGEPGSIQEEDLMRMIMVYKYSRSPEDLQREAVMGKISQLEGALSPEAKAQYDAFAKPFRHILRNSSGEKDSSSSRFDFAKLSSSLTSVLGSEKFDMLPVTQFVSALLRETTSKEATILAKCKGIDPKLGAQVDLQTCRFNEAIVFAVGGGTYTEQANLQQWAKTQLNRRVVYGGSEMCTPKDFLRQSLALMKNDADS